MAKIRRHAKRMNPYADLKTAMTNADWIKHADGGKARKRELAIHEELADKYRATVAATKSAATMGRILKGGKGSGNFGHKGRPGKRGGSAPQDYMFDGVAALESVEGKIVIDRKPGSAIGRMREGITREQMNRYYKRRTAVQDAWLYRYQDRTSAAEHVNARIKQGYTKMKKVRGGHVRLVNPETGDEQLYRRGVEIDYIKTILDVGEFKRNY